MFAPILTFEALKLIKALPTKEREKLCPVFQRGFGHWAHLEQVLLCCLSSDDIDVRSKGIVTILKIREGKTQHDKGPKRKKKGNHGICKFEVPSFCYDAQDFTLVTDWEKEQMTDPPYTARMSNEEIGLSFNHCTMGQNHVILRHPIIHFPTSKGVSEVSERANE